jgi:hypothetical protein
MKTKKVQEKHPLVVFESKIFLSKDGFNYKRQIYSFFDLLGDMGGVTQAIVLMFAFIFIPIAEHEFIIAASNKLFYARTKTAGLFKYDKKHHGQKHVPKFDSIKATKEIKKHHVIYLSTADTTKLFFSNIMGKFYPFKNWEKRSKLSKLYQIGQNRIESELNIVKLMNSLRNLKILLRSSIMDKDI